MIIVPSVCYDSGLLYTRREQSVCSSYTNYCHSILSSVVWIASEIRFKC